MAKPVNSDYLFSWELIQKFPRPGFELLHHSPFKRRPNGCFLCYESGIQDYNSIQPGSWVMCGGEGCGVVMWEYNLVGNQSLASMSRQGTNYWWSSSRSWKVGFKKPRTIPLKYSFEKKEIGGVVSLKLAWLLLPKPP